MEITIPRETEARSCEGSLLEEVEIDEELGVEIRDEVWVRVGEVVLGYVGDDLRFRQKRDNLRPG